MTTIDKDHPSADWIEQLSQRFPVEREVDNTLRRKLQLRAAQPYVPQTLDALLAGTRRLIAAHHGDDVDIAQASWLTGGASKLQMAFTLGWAPEGGARRQDKMVLRMEPASSVTETSRLREFQLLQAFAQDLPVPKAYWVDAEAQYLPYPALIYSFASGVTKPSATVSNVTGLFPSAHTAPKSSTPLVSNPLRIWNGLPRG